ncbi:MAG: hypothetical protein HC907_17885, partial [Richelia sp. SM1_7_0]|nr:hypothetical protein [Richelia sp. SM1_7_0]
QVTTNNIAVQMAGEGKADAAKYLHHWAKQINHLFEVAVHHQGSDEKSQAYLKLIQSLLDCPSGSEVDILAANEQLNDNAIALVAPSHQPDLLPLIGLFFRFLNTGVFSSGIPWSAFTE